MNEIAENDVINIENMIYEIRGVQVMLSSDVAKLYRVETKVLNQTIKRNINRFPERFCFQLNEEEIDELSSRSQFVTLNKSNNLRGYNIKYLPYALTEQGIMMLSGLLKSDIAVKVNIQIIDAFVKMRKYFTNNSEILISHENRILKLEKVFNKMQEKKKESIILFEGEIYDAHSLLLDIINEAKEEIIIIDNYAGKELLDILKDTERKITIVSKNINDKLKKKYLSQYNNVSFIDNSLFHDRFIIIDRKKLYSCGASFKDLGKKCFAIHQFNDLEYLDRILGKIQQ